MGHSEAIEGTGMQTSKKLAHDEQKNFFYLLSQRVKDSFELSIEVDVFEILDLSVSTT